jgi:dolichyl-phosphate-mannose--protein O-mannosyl transferase
MLFGLAGWFVGFDGQFQFENIGDSYTTTHVPFVGMRALPAILGSLTIPVIYAIMKESGYSTVIAAFSACIVLFGACFASFGRFFSLIYDLFFLDNAHVTQSRLILLDATLIFFMSLTIYAYIRFRKLRYRYEFDYTLALKFAQCFLQRVFDRMVDVACIDWRLYGMHLGLEGQWHSDRFCDRFCCFD